MKTRTRILSGLVFAALSALGITLFLVANASAKPPKNPCPQCPPICQNGLRCVVDSCGSDCSYTCWFDPSCG